MTDHDPAPPASRLHRLPRRLIGWMSGSPVRGTTAVLAVVFFVGAAVVFGAIIAVQREVRTDVNDNALWAAFQLDREAGRMAEALKDFRGARSRDGADQLGLRLSILVSRVDILKRPMYVAAYGAGDDVLRPLAPVGTRVSALAATMDSIADPLTMPAPVVDRLIDEVTELRHDTNKVVLTVTQAITERRAVQREMLLRLYTLFAVLVALMTMAVLVLVGHVLRSSAELSRSRAQLLDLTQRLTEAADRAEDASRAKSAFLANMSHEIRTPLNGVIGSADLLLAGDLTTDQRRLVTTNRTSAISLLSLIDNVLDLSRMEAEAVPLESQAFDPLAEAEAVMSMNEPRVRANGILAILVPDLPAGRRYLGDAVRVRQILLNLVTNAVKFTLSGTVVVRLAEDTGRFVIEVEDTGIGVPEDKRHLLFREFTQIDPTITRRFGGSGLGLAISRRLVDLMGGTIAFAPGTAGARFRVVLPLAIAADGPVNLSWRGLTATVTGRSALESEALEALVRALGAVVGPERGALTLVVETEGSPRAATGRLLSGGQTRFIGPVLTPWHLTGLSTAMGERDMDLPEWPLRILLAEDDTVSREITAMILAKAGHTVTPVENGTLAVEMARLGVHDLVLMDLSMPEMDGLTAAHRIRADEAGGRRIPIIAVSANTNAWDRQACIDAGMDGFVAKPVSWDAIRAALRTAVPGATNAADGPTVDLDPARLAALFRRDADVLIAAASTGDDARARDALHALKGLAATVGLGEIADMAQVLHDSPAERAAGLTALRARVAEVG